MKTQIWLTAVLFIVNRALADAPSSLYANPTTCTTSIRSPSPTGKLCGVRGTVSKAVPLGGSSYVDHENASPNNTCRTVCLSDPQCRSYGLQTFPKFEDTHYTCQKYSDTVASQGFQGARSLVEFWDRDCYTVNCKTQKVTPPSKTTCSPAATDVIRDSSFEAAGNGPWNVGKGVTLEKNQTNAASGKGYAFHYTKRGSTLTLEQTIGNVNQSAVYLFRYLIKVAVNRLNPKLECALTYGGGATIDLYSGLQPKHYAAQLASGYLKPNTTVSLQFSCQEELESADSTSSDLEFFVDDVTYTNLATNCPFVLQLRSTDSSINGQYLSIRALDLVNVDDNVSQLGRTSDLAAAPRWGQTPIGMVYLQDPILKPYNRILSFDPGTAYHNYAYVEYGSEISAGNSAGEFGSGFESCRVIKDGSLRCNHNGQNRFVFCKNEDTLYLDNPAKYPAGYEACTPVELAVVFV